MPKKLLIVHILAAVFTILILSAIGCSPQSSDSTRGPGTPATPTEEQPPGEEGPDPEIPVAFEDQKTFYLSNRKVLAEYLNDEILQMDHVEVATEEKINSASNLQILETSLKGKKQKRIEKQAQIEQIKEQIKENDKSRESLIQSLEQRKLALEKVELEYSQHLKETEEFEILLKGEKQKLLHLEKEYEVAKAPYNQAKQERKASEAQIGVLAKQIENLKGSIEEVRIVNNKVAKKINAKRKDRRDIFEKFQELEPMQLEKTQAVNREHTRVSELKVEIKIEKQKAEPDLEKIKALEIKLEYAQGALSQAQGDLKEILEKVAMLELKLEEKDDEITSLELEQAKNQRLIYKIQIKIGEAKSQISEVETEIVFLKQKEALEWEKLKPVQQKVNAQQLVVTQGEEQTKQLQKKSEALVAQIEALKKAQADDKKSIALLETTNEGLKGEIASLMAELSTIDLEVAAAEEKVSDAKIALNEADIKVKAAEQELKLVQENVTYRMRMRVLTAQALKEQADQFPASIQLEPVPEVEASWLVKMENLTGEVLEGLILESRHDSFLVNASPRKLELDLDIKATLITLDFDTDSEKPVDPTFEVILLQDEILVAPPYVQMVETE